MAAGLRGLADASHVALVRSLGAVEILTVDAYRALPNAAVKGTYVRALSRLEHIRLRARAKGGSQ